MEKIINSEDVLRIISVQYELFTKGETLASMALDEILTEITKYINKYDSAFANFGEKYFIEKEVMKIKTDNIIKEQALVLKDIDSLGGLFSYSRNNKQLASLKYYYMFLQYKLLSAYFNINEIFIIYFQSYEFQNNKKISDLYENLLLDYFNKCPNTFISNPTKTVNTERHCLAIEDTNINIKYKHKLIKLFKFISMYEYIIRSLIQTFIIEYNNMQHNSLKDLFKLYNKYEDSFLETFSDNINIIYSLNKQLEDIILLYNKKITKTLRPDFMKMYLFVPCEFIDFFEAYSE